ncbi:MAG: glycosyltransferase family 8 protein [Oscillospiraceae bacterium]
MNILVTLNSGYIRPLCVMLKSLLIAQPETKFTIYVINSSLTLEDYKSIDDYLENDRYSTVDIKITDDMLESAPITDRYPREMYYRIFAARYLPKTVDKVLYLDPDLIVLRSLESLYNSAMGSYFFAAASHVNEPLRKLNEIRLQMETSGPYINSGVMLMNIKLLRQFQDFNQVFDYVNKNKKLLLLPDQDIISAIYSDKIIEIDPYIYNMTERLMLLPLSAEKKVTFDWVCENSAVVHYCGRNKPWKEHYIGVLGTLYNNIIRAPMPV